MKNPQVKYRLLKEVAINLASLGIPLSFLAGFSFGRGDYVLGLLVLAAYLGCDNLASRLWLRVLEMMHD